LTYPWPLGFFTANERCRVGPQARLRSLTAPGRFAFTFLALAALLLPDTREDLDSWDGATGRGEAPARRPSLPGLQRSATAAPPNAHRQVFRVNGTGSCLDLSRTSPETASSRAPLQCPCPLRSIPKGAPERPTENPREALPQTLFRRPLRRPKARQVPVAPLKCAPVQKRCQTPSPANCEDSSRGPDLLS
jgi:hypothetical protein